jgi:hypothetical protein
VIHFECGRLSAAFADSFRKGVFAAHSVAFARRFRNKPVCSAGISSKPGADMLYAQWLFDSGADVQGVAVPRRNLDTGRVEADQSSAGIKWRGFAGSQQQLGIDLMLAKDYRDAVLGAGISGSAAGASWTVEVVPTRLHGGGVRTSALANAQYAWVLGGKNLNGYVEYFHNGFGMSGSGYALTELPLRPNQVDRRRSEQRAT